MIFKKFMKGSALCTGCLALMFNFLILFELLLARSVFGHLESSKSALLGMQNAGAAYPTLLLQTEARLNIWHNDPMTTLAFFGIIIELNNGLLNRFITNYKKFYFWRSVSHLDL